jgi:hypothetical protein
MKSILITPWKWKLILIAASILVISGYLLTSAQAGFSGFPLDDAWIHQVYARNLAERGEWAFNPGQPSGGSTSPLWSLLLAAGLALHFSPVFWSAFLGCITLFLTAVFAENLVRLWLPDRITRVPWVGLLFVAEWHLVWAAVSGMETSLFICFILAIFLILHGTDPKYGLAGLLIGLSVWVRPDGITLLAPAFMLILLGTGSYSVRIKRALELLGVFLLVFIPYLFFNLNLAGSIWPSTFSAKQAEYVAATGYPILERIGSLFLPFLAGGGVILLPGVVAAAIFSWKRRLPGPAALILWFAGYIILFAIRLPVNYQHGRYMMPAMAVYFLIGLWGMILWMKNWTVHKWQNLARVFWAACTVTVTSVFLIMGSTVFSTDVSIIETEMVATARWIKENTPAGSRVAAHDIGAMGYFSGHEIVDLAGLVNPEVIPIFRDEEKLSDYLTKQNVQYLVTFPNWYPVLTHNRIPIFVTSGKASPQSGGENMAVYPW